MGIVLKSLSSILSNYIGIDRPLIWDSKITTRCNCRCVFCNIWSMDHSGELNTDQVKDLATQVNQLGCTVASFSGGEPLLRKDMGEILKYSKTMMRTNLISNGTLLKDRIKEVGPYCDNITVSLDAPDDTHDKLRRFPGIFKKAVASIEAAKEYASMSINCVITEENLDKVTEMPKFAQKLGIRAVSFEPVVSLGDFSKDSYDIKKLSRYQEVIKELISMKKAGYPIANSIDYLEVVSYQKKWKCKGHTLYIRTDHKGDIILPCGTWDGIYGKKHFSTKGKKVKDVWFSSKAEASRRKADKCPYLDKCTFPCVVEPSLMYYGSFSTIKSYIGQGMDILYKDPATNKT